MSRPRYVHGHQESVLRAHRWRTAQNSAGYLLGQLRPGMSLLDVGCGPGAHQVLQHLADPVRALREMGRVCRPGGIVAARDGDYAGITWFPALPGAGRVAGALPAGGSARRR